MTAGVKTIFCVFLVSALGAQGSTVRATPVQKVVDLLKDLSKKLAAEGKEEAVQYDEYACFCKEQADEKWYAMEKSKNKIAHLKAEIAEVSSAKTELENDMAEAFRAMQMFDHDIDDKTEKRKAQHAHYTAEANDISEAIDSCSAAIDALKNHKKALTGAKIDLVEVTGDLVKVMRKQPLLEEAPSALTFLSKFDDTAAPSFDYQSNDIIASLEGVLMEFKSLQKDKDQDEIKANSLFEKNRGALANQRKFAEKARAEKKAIAEAKTEDLHEAQGFKKTEEDDRNADKAFVDRLSGECNAQALLFDARSKVRSGELTALAKATDELVQRAVPNAEAGFLQKGAVGKVPKKISELQYSSVGRAGKRLSPGPVTLVQISNAQHRESRGEETLQRVRSFLADAAERTDSSALSAIAMRVAVSNANANQVDHFVKVRGLIKDLIQKLKDDAASESDQKADCDAGIKQAIGDRDKAQARIEEVNGRITMTDAKVNQLKEDNQSMFEQIAELKKALLEATELSVKEVATLNENLRMCREGTHAVETAITILEGFYSKTALLQTSQRQPVDRDGNEIGDLAQAPLDSSYDGATHESEGIIGILEVILADFKRSGRQTLNDRDANEDDQKEFKKTSEADVVQKDKKITANDVAISGQNEELVEKENDLRDATALLTGAKKTLEGWAEMCIQDQSQSAQAEAWDERRKKREEEIAALKQATDILDHWQD